MIYFCIPAYNEATTIGVLLWKIRQVMADLPRDYEILVLDDASTDHTKEVLAPYAKVLPLTVIRQDPQRGYASAVERLIREAVGRSTHPRRDVIITMQADFTETPENIPSLIKRIEGGADVVEAAIVSEGTDVPRGLRWTRRSIPFLLRGMSATPVSRDPVSGFRAYRVSVLKRVLSDRQSSPLLTTKGWAANVELMVAVSGHSRRTEGFDAERRYEMRQRESRFEPWNTVVDLWHVSRQLRGLASPSPSAPAGNTTTGE